MDRNLTDYHAEAIAARWLYGKEYARQNGGQLDFYESLSPERKMVVKLMVDEIRLCPRRAATPASGGPKDG